MAQRLSDGSIQMKDGRLIFANSVIIAADLAELMPLFTPPPAWPFMGGGGGGGGSFVGPSGTPGPRGTDGAPGAPGVQGPQGTNPGVQGPQGLAGTQGSQGNQGLVGAQGNQGNQGNQGLGAQGLQGFQGTNPGPAGPQGSAGTQGNQGSASPINTAMVSWAGASGDIDCPTGFVPKVAIVIQGNNFNAGNSGTSVGFAIGTGVAQQADAFEGQCDSSALATGGSLTGEAMRYLTSCVGTISVGTITQFDSTRVRLNLTGVCTGSMLVFG